MTIEERVDELFGGADMLRPFRNGEVLGKYDDGFNRDAIRSAFQEVARDQRAACGNAIVESYGRTKGAKISGESAYQTVMNATLE